MGCTPTIGAISQASWCVISNAKASCGHGGPLLQRSSSCFSLLASVCCKKRQKLVIRRTVVLPGCQAARWSPIVPSLEVTRKGKTRKGKARHSLYRNNYGVVVPYVDILNSSTLASLSDAQANAKYVPYAIYYIYALLIKPRCDLVVAARSRRPMDTEVLAIEASSCKILWRHQPKLPRHGGELDCLPRARVGDLYAGAVPAKTEKQFLFTRCARTEAILRAFDEIGWPHGLAQRLSYIGRHARRPPR